MPAHLSADPLFVDREDGPGSIRLAWRGSSRDRQPQLVLGPFLASQVEDASKDGRAIEMRFEDLEYFNSATVMAIIAAVRAARSKNVPVRLVYDASREWQRLSFEPMRVFATGGAVELVPLESLAPPGATR